MDTLCLVRWKKSLSLGRALGEGIAYDVQPREQKVPSLSICTDETCPLPFSAE